ncbi:MAG: DUF6184 family natural product biosynthesis lipoprotein [Myxococcota bacterium]
MNARGLAAVTFLAVSGCGWSLDAARESAATKACNYYQRCEQVGDGKMYPSSDECITRQRTYWLDAWPTNLCEGKVNSAAVDACLKAIDNTACNSLIDFLATLDKCDKKNTCAP